MNRPDRFFPDLARPAPLNATAIIRNVAQPFWWPLLVSDLLALAACMGLATLLLRLPFFPSPDSVFWTQSAGLYRYVMLGIEALLIVLWLWIGRGQYTKRRPVLDEYSELAGVVIFMALLDAAVLYLTKMPFSRVFWVSFWNLSLPLLIGMRVLVKLTLLNARRWKMHVVVVGDGDNAREAMAALRSEPTMGFEIVAQIGVQGCSEQSILHALEPFGKVGIVVALDQDQQVFQENLLQSLSLRYESVTLVPPLRELTLQGMDMMHFFGHEVIMLNMRNNLGRQGDRLIKRSFDVLVSMLLLILLAPLMLVLAGLIRLDGHAALFKHRRVGQNGKTFRCYKFRSMVPNAQQALEDMLEADPDARAEWQRVRKLRNDPRVTRIGSFMRRTSLDELPQLWNVLRGDMSLVGPRPITAEELLRYGDRSRFYLIVKPGITGLWQISGRNDLDYDARIALDAWYVRNWSLLYDLLILFKTIRVVCSSRGAY